MWFSYLLPLCLFLSLVEVYAETEFPFVTFMGKTLPNHSYVDLSLVDDRSNSIQCHTNLPTCCTSSQGVDRGDWIPPGSELRLPFNNKGDIYEVRTSQRVEMKRWNNGTLSGIYRCDIPTRLGPTSVLIGLYANGGIL